jgi:peptidoglycan-associated lipoprotein
MRIFKLSMLVVLTATLVLGGAGCKKKPGPVTPIPGRTDAGPTVVDNTPQKPVTLPPGLGDSTGVKPGTETISLPANTDGTIPPTGGYNRENFKENREFFKANTVYFDFDRAAVKASERVRVEEVAAYLKGKPGHMVEIEGHCDERGTEEYNRALGERRALAVREYLVNLGIQAERIHTISYGEDRPAEIGSSEGAWAKNRRGEFILLEPRQ